MPPPADLVAQLGARGVDYSVPLTDLEQWLADPVDTPYPAMAQALLALLGARTLLQPVYLDVIEFDYEARAGKSPRAVADVDVAVLQAAVVEASNERHGTAVTAFADLLVPLPPPSPPPPPPPPPPSPIEVKWGQLGGAGGFLGGPVGDEVTTPDGVGRTRDFAGGTIAWHPTTGAHSVGGLIGARWRDLGRERWGFPITDETATPDGAGRYNHFRAVTVPGTPEASIYWTNPTGAHEVVGGIREKWAALGWETGVGYPLGPEGPRHGGGRIQEFQNNSIGWTSLAGAFLGRFTVKQFWSTKTALGGDASFDLVEDGSYHFRGRASDTGIANYDFRVRGTIRSPDGLVLTAQKGGSVKDQTLWDEPGTSPLLELEYPFLQPDTFAVTKEYSTSGVIGAVGSILTDLANFLVTDVVAGAEVAAVLLVANELSRATGTSVLGLSGIAGTLVTAGATLLLGPGFVVPLFVGAAIATELLVDHRQIHDDEYAFADLVFRGTLLPPEKITLTNMSGAGGRAFTAPDGQGGAIVNLGPAYSAPGGPMRATSLRYPVPGQVLIHELTHAWQLARHSFIAGYVCRGAMKSDYKPLPAGSPWGDFDLEEQAATVDIWFGTHAVTPPVPPLPPTTPPSVPWATTTDLKPMLEGLAALNDPWFQYIDGKIRLAIPD